jgi:hypothetical protein
MQNEIWRKEEKKMTDPRIEKQVKEYIAQFREEDCQRRKDKICEELGLYLHKEAGDDFVTYRNMFMVGIYEKMPDKEEERQESNREANV